MKKYFRFHRGSFAESMTTMTEVDGLEDIKRVVQEECNSMALPIAVTNIRISKSRWNDTRVPDAWGDSTYYVLADMDEYKAKSKCIGMCNFYEE